MIAVLPAFVGDLAAMLGVAVAVGALFAIPGVRSQWKLRITEPNRMRRREDVVEAMTPICDPIAADLVKLSKRLDDHMAAEEGQRDADHADRSKQRERLAEQLGSIEARLESGHRWMAKTDDRLDSLGREIAAMHHRALSAPAEPRRFP